MSEIGFVWGVREVEDIWESGVKWDVPTAEGVARGQWTMLACFLVLLGATCPWHSRALVKGQES